jgi:hypothetical protein
LACADQFIRTGELEHDDADNDEGTPSTPDGSQPDELSVSAEADGARRWHLPPRTDYTPLQTPPPSGPAAPADTPLSARAAAEAAAAAAAAAHAGHVHSVKQKEEDARREASVLTLFVRLFSGHRRLGGLVAEIVTQMERDEREYEVFRKVCAAYSHSRSGQLLRLAITAGVTLWTPPHLTWLSRLAKPPSHASSFCAAPPRRRGVLCGDLSEDSARPPACCPPYSEYSQGVLRVLTGVLCGDLSEASARPPACRFRSTTLCRTQAPLSTTREMTKPGVATGPRRLRCMTRR